jgi:CDP-diacylglycerol--glycerol-3-phosphate 3-phosphatidyltransferase
MAKNSSPSHRVDTNASPSTGFQVPLALTVLRLILSPVFAIVFYFTGAWGPILALIVAVAMEVSDFVDGLTARRWNQVTDLGKLLDPLADSISRLTVWACFASSGLVPVGVFLAMLYRDAVVAFTRTLCAYRKEVLSARISGKIKAWIQALGALAILVMSVAAGEWVRQPAFPVLGILVAIATVWSGIDYVWSNRRAFRTSPLKH